MCFEIIEMVTQDMNWGYELGLLGGIDFSGSGHFDMSRQEKHGYLVTLMMTMFSLGVSKPCHWGPGTETPNLKLM